MLKPVLQSSSPTVASGWARKADDRGSEVDYDAEGGSLGVLLW